MASRASPAKGNGRNPGEDLAEWTDAIGVWELVSVTAVTRQPARHTTEARGTGLLPQNADVAMVRDGFQPVPVCHKHKRHHSACPFNNYLGSKARPTCSNSRGWLCKTAKVRLNKVESNTDHRKAGTRHNIQETSNVVRPQMVGSNKHHHKDKAGTGYSNPVASNRNVGTSTKGNRLNMLGTLPRETNREGHLQCSDYLVLS
jgi:hypothetical protein